MANEKEGCLPAGVAWRSMDICPPYLRTWMRVVVAGHTGLTLLEPVQDTDFRWDGNPVQERDDGQSCNRPEPLGEERDCQFVPC